MTEAAIPLPIPSPPSRLDRLRRPLPRWVTSGLLLLVLWPLLWLGWQVTRWLWPLPNGLKAVPVQQVQWTRHQLDPRITNRNMKWWDVVRGPAGALYLRWEEPGGAGSWVIGKLEPQGDRLMLTEHWDLPGRQVSPSQPLVDESGLITVRPNLSRDHLAVVWSDPPLRLDVPLPHPPAHPRPGSDTEVWWLPGSTTQSAAGILSLMHKQEQHTLHRYWVFTVDRDSAAVQISPLGDLPLRHQVELEAEDGHWRAWFLRPDQVTVTASCLFSQDGTVIEALPALDPAAIPDLDLIGIERVRHQGLFALSYEFEGVGPAEGLLEQFPPKLTQFANELRQAIRVKSVTVHERQGMAFSAKPNQQLSQLLRDCMTTGQMMKLLQTRDGGKLLAVPLAGRTGQGLVIWQSHLLLGHCPAGSDTWSLTIIQLPFKPSLREIETGGLEDLVETDKGFQVAYWHRGTTEVREIMTAVIPRWWEP